MFSPTQTGVTFLVMLTVTTSLYYWFPPEPLLNGEANRVGWWGPPNSEINWCEIDYTTFFYVAEPYNTFSSLLYCFVPLIATYLHPLQLLEPRHVLLLVICFAIGIGSALFHGSLRYHMQLLDELPMVHLVLCTLFHLLYRNDTKSHSTVAFLLISISAVVSITMFFTEREHIFHYISRITLILMFSSGFVGIFFLLARSAREADEMLLKQCEPSETVTKPSYFFTQAFLLFVFALVSWVTDILCCALLQSLPINPQLHAFGWHLLSALALYVIFMVLLIHRRLVKGDRVRVGWTFGGYIPYVSVGALKKKL